MNLKFCSPLTLLQAIVPALIFLALTGCQQSPTKIVTQHTRPQAGGFVKANASIDQSKITADVLVVDVRPRLNYSLAHLEGSLHIDTDEFFETKGKFKGYPKADTEAILRRLAQLGFSPAVPTLIIGEGKKGNGAEGRLAWLLKSLGVQKVEIVAFDGINNRKVINGDPSLNLTSKEVWAASLDKSLFATKEDIKNFAAGVHIKKSQRVHLIDVRSEAEYFKKMGFGEGYETPNLNAINIPWTEFIRDDGRINREILVRLKGVNIKPDDRIIVISSGGIRSSYVAFVLFELGYKRVANAIGGLQEVML